MGVVVCIEGNVIRGAFGTRPERQTVGVEVVLGEDSHEVANVVIKVEVKYFAGNSDAAREVSALLEQQELLDFLKGSNGG